MELKIDNSFKHNLRYILNKTNIQEDKTDRLVENIKSFYRSIEKMKESEELKFLYQTAKKPAKKSYIIKVLIEKGLSNKQISYILDVPNSTIEYLKKVDSTLDYTYRTKVLNCLK